VETRVVAYVDGFNLYHGVRDKLGRSQLWIDIQSLAAAILLPGQRLDGVEYFTARVRDDAASVHRQARYLSALTAACPLITISEGHFQRRVDVCRTCGVSRSTFDEKETDVNIASALIRDGVNARYDVALLVSADADLAPAVLTARQLARHVRIVSAFPPRRRSDRLRRVSNGAFTIGDAKIRAAQLPDKIILTDGTALERPAYWR
jgi:uncharacterized LabA/DUF88 family protein